MKSITPSSAVPGTIATDNYRLQFTMDSVEANKFSISDPVLVTGFESYGFNDGMALYARAMDFNYRTVLVRFERQI